MIDPSTTWNRLIAGEELTEYQMNQLPSINPLPSVDIIERAVFDKFPLLSLPCQHHVVLKLNDGRIVRSQDAKSCQTIFNLYHERMSENDKDHCVDIKSQVEQRGLDRRRPSAFRRFGGAIVRFFTRN